SDSFSIHPASRRSAWINTASAGGYALPGRPNAAEVTASMAGLSSGVSRRTTTGQPCSTESAGRAASWAACRITQAYEARSIHKRRQSRRHIDAAERSDAQRPSAAELLAKRVGNTAPLQLPLVTLRTLVSGRAMEGGVDAVAAIVDRPDGQLVRRRSTFHGRPLGIAHGVLIGSGERALEPGGGASTKRRLGLS